MVCAGGGIAQENSLTALPGANLRRRKSILVENFPDFNASMNLFRIRHCSFGERGGQLFSHSRRSPSEAFYEAVGELAVAVVGASGFGRLRKSVFRIRSGFAGVFCLQSIQGTGRLGVQPSKCTGGVWCKFIRRVGRK